MTGAPLRVGVVGCGFQGRLHLETLAREPGIVVAGVCDLDESRALAAASEFGAEGQFVDYRAMLASGPFDVVTICTMPSSHLEIARAAFGAGAHVLCEKPMAMSAAEAAEMERAARAAGRELRIGFNMRFMDAAIAARRAIEAGEIGELVCARGHMLADDVPWWGRHYDRALSGGGALAATAVHMLDLVRFLAGNPAPVTATASAATLFPLKRSHGAPSDEARAAYSVDDLIFGHVRFEGGFWMSIEGAWVWDLGGGWNYGFDLVGTKAQIRFDPFEIRGEVDGTVRRLDDGAVLATDFPGSVARELLAFLQVVRDPSHRSSIATAREGVEIQALVDALYASASVGRELVVDVPAAPAGSPEAA
ncbi:MAG: Gfo/Idh/MocA family oxidoreductase [Gaiellales bacterium]